MLTTTQPQLANKVNLEQRQTLVLRAWEAVSAERELQGVLEAITQVMVPIVPYDGVAIISFDGANHDCYAAHIVGFPRREGETLREYFGRPEFVRQVETPIRPLMPYDLMNIKHKTDGAPYACNDLFAKEAWYEHEFGLAASGIRAYASIPMIVREKLIGVAAFSRKLLLTAIWRSFKSYRERWPWPWRMRWPTRRFANCATNWSRRT